MPSFPFSKSIASNAIVARPQVDHWKNSNQKQRWMATALRDIEPQIKGYRHLPRLQRTLKETVKEKSRVA